MWFLRRWNTLAAEHVGVTLQLMPMLLGFLTYKVRRLKAQTRTS